MGVVRREGDWRLEKRDKGAYEITYREDPQLKVLTSEYSPRMMDDAMLDAIPVREVDSYSEAESLFEEMAQQGRPAGIPSVEGGFSSPLTTDTGVDSESDFEELEDLPPGGFAIVLLVAGGIIFGYTGFQPESMVFKLAGLMIFGGLAIFGWASSTG